jgi:hypothetical protein
VALEALDPGNGEHSGRIETTGEQNDGAISTHEDIVAKE